MATKKPLTLNKTAIQSIKNEAIEETMIMVGAYLMDELNYDPEKIVDIWLGVERYAKAAKEHLISIADVCKIIDEHTGLKVLKRYANNTIHRR